MDVGALITSEYSVSKLRSCIYFKTALLVGLNDDRPLVQLWKQDRDGTAGKGQSWTQVYREACCSPPIGLPCRHVVVGQALAARQVQPCRFTAVPVVAPAGVVDIEPVHG